MKRANSRTTVSNRRQVLKAVGGATAAVLSVRCGLARAQDLKLEPVVKNGRIRQSIVHWCFADYWDVPAMIRIAKGLGCKSIELISPQFFGMLKEHGLECAIASIDMSPDPPFVKGFNNPKYHDRVIKATRDAIDACAQYGFKRVISFTGMREDISDEDGIRNCVAGYKKIVGYAEKKGVTLCLEMLNTRDSSHPMKGHPGYQGNHTDYCIEIIKQVGSPNLKFLFDVYHVQIMDGDIIRRIRQLKEYVAHVHTAGNPGRGELDDRQEINYRAVMQALVDIGYDGFVGQEFIPTRDPLAGLRQAVEVCDV
ncbi:MAG: hydroxypyruvate isomerase [Pirellulaceae bacterium]|nr:MAG: hydroxypyruvate isomerase [Pirellulaceae bacterium]